MYKKGETRGKPTKTESSKEKARSLEGHLDFWRRQKKGRSMDWKKEEEGERKRKRKIEERKRKEEEEEQ